eukprot:CAMPEP_0172357632 /NCGR_PEP_ID=MMETSP1060-20121228/1999_1 /TAXON_ID=37318 /ORGANISM="Pseudo-nitzschia pungens, Strain cf. cingulata" /LENGTH=814 /DNA_ID=CAMNT_0013078415 /DNA_START=387 /DNA_END=2831 /DNA_ORIENTATION=+
MSAPTIEPTAFTTNQESESLSSLDGSGIGVLDDVPIIRPSASPTIEPTTNPTTMLPTPFFTATTIPIPEPTVPPVPVPSPVQAPVEVPPPVLSDVQVTSPPTEETSLAAIYDDDDDDDDDDQVITLSPTLRPILAPTVREPTFNVHDKGGTVQGNGERWDAVGFQSNWGTTHTGSMVYDFTRNSIYLTGTTFTTTANPTPESWQRSTCFVGEVPIADISDWKTVDDPMPINARYTSGFKLPDSLAEKELMSCQVIYYEDSVEADNFLYIGGVNEMDAQVRRGDISGLLNVYQRSEEKPDWRLEMMPSSSIDVNQSDKKSKVPIRYPVAMTNGRRDGREVLMVVMVSSDDNLLTEEYIEAGDANNPKNRKNSLLPPGLYPLRGYPKRGSGFWLSYQILGYDSVARNFEFLLGEDLTAGNTETYPTGVVNLAPRGFRPVVVGHVKGRAPDKFGMLQGPLSTADDVSSLDTDGFVQFMNLASGMPTYDTSLRISSIEMEPPLDDFIHDVCLGEKGPDGQHNEFYIVGSTYGTIEVGDNQLEINTNILNNVMQVSTDGNHVSKLSAYVAKVENGRHVWTTQLYAVNDKNKLNGAKTEAFGCHMIQSDPSLLYVGGTVYNGAVMDSNHRSAGGDDVWVIQMSTEDGSLKWIKQVGSAGDDRISPSKGIQAALNGDAIVYGETNGELYRVKAKEGESISDIFVTSFVKKDGYTIPSLSHQEAGSKKGGTIGVGITLMIISIVICGFIFFKFRRPQRRGQSRPHNKRDGSEGIFTDNMAPPQFRDEDDLPMSNGNGSHSTNGSYSDQEPDVEIREPEKTFV